MCEGPFIPHTPMPGWDRRVEALIYVYAHVHASYLVYIVVCFQSGCGGIACVCECACEDVVGVWRGRGDIVWTDGLDVCRMATR